jgi:hypothetical protein
MSFKQLWQISEHAKSIQQNVRFEYQTISENIQKPKQEKCKDFEVFLNKFKNIQDFEFLFSNSRTFKDIQEHSRTFRFCTTLSKCIFKNVAISTPSPSIMKILF